MACTLSNKCAKNISKRTVLLQLIIKNVVTCFFGTQCIISVDLPSCKLSRRSMSPSSRRLYSVGLTEHIHTKVDRITADLITDKTHTSVAFVDKTHKHIQREKKMNLKENESEKNNRTIKHLGLHR